MPNIDVSFPCFLAFIVADKKSSISLINSYLFCWVASYSFDFKSLLWNTMFIKRRNLTVWWNNCKWETCRTTIHLVVTPEIPLVLHPTLFPKGANFRSLIVIVSLLFFICTIITWVPHNFSLVLCCLWNYLNGTM